MTMSVKLKKEIYVKHKNKHRRHVNLMRLRNSGRNYKKQIHKVFSNYKQNTVNIMCLLKAENLKDNWNINHSKKNF